MDRPESGADEHRCNRGDAGSSSDVGTLQKQQPPPCSDEEHSRPSADAYSGASDLSWLETGDDGDMQPCDERPRLEVAPRHHVRPYRSAIQSSHAVDGYRPNDREVYHPDPARRERLLEAELSLQLSHSFANSNAKSPPPLSPVPKQKPQSPTSAFVMASPADNAPERCRSRPEDGRNLRLSPRPPMHCSAPPSPIQQWMEMRISRMQENRWCGLGDELADAANNEARIERKSRTPVGDSRVCDMQRSVAHPSAWLAKSPSRDSLAGTDGNSAMEVCVIVEPPLQDAAELHSACSLLAVPMMCRDDRHQPSPHVDLENPATHDTLLSGRSGRTAATRRLSECSHVFSIAPSENSMSGSHGLATPELAAAMAPTTTAHPNDCLSPLSAPCGSSLVAPAPHTHGGRADPAAASPLLRRSPMSLTKDAAEVVAESDREAQDSPGLAGQSSASDEGVKRSRLLSIPYLRSALTALRSMSNIPLAEHDAKQKSVNWVTSSTPPLGSTETAADDTKDGTLKNQSMVDVLQFSVSLQLARSFSVSAATLDSTTVAAEVSREALIEEMEKRKRKLQRQLTSIQREAMSRNIFALVRASNMAQMQFLLQHKLCDIHERDYNGCTVLHIAANEGNQSMVSLLVSHDANPMAVDYNGRTPRDWAVLSRHSGVSRYLLLAAKHYQQRIAQQRLAQTSVARLGFPVSRSRSPEEHSLKLPATPGALRNSQTEPLDSSSATPYADQLAASRLYGANEEETPRATTKTLSIHEHRQSPSQPNSLSATGRPPQDSCDESAFAADSRVSMMPSAPDDQREDRSFTTGYDEASSMTISYPSLATAGNSRCIPNNWYTLLHPESDLATAAEEADLETRPATDSLPPMGDAMSVDVPLAGAASQPESMLCIEGRGEQHRRMLVAEESDAKDAANEEEEDDGIEERDEETQAFSRYSTISDTVSLIVCMVGLPGRGKSFISRRIARYLNWKGVPCRTFNAGNYRRELLGVEETSGAGFFDPNNEEARNAREEMAHLACKDLIKFLGEHHLAVGILDATNTTRERRKHVTSFFQEEAKHLHRPCRVIFIESVCANEDIITENILRAKCGNGDYKNVTDANQVICDFRERIKQYEKVYETLDEAEGLSFMKIINVKQHVVLHRIPTGLGSRIAFFLLNLHPVAFPIYIALPGETVGDEQKVYAGDERLTPAGERYSIALRNFIHERYVPDMVVLHATNRSVMNTLRPAMDSFRKPGDVDCASPFKSAASPSSQGQRHFGLGHSGSCREQGKRASGTATVKGQSVTAESSAIDRVASSSSGGSEDDSDGGDDRATVDEVFCPLPGLDNINFGRFAGQTAAQVREMYPRLSQLLFTTTTPRASVDSMTHLFSAQAAVACEGNATCPVAALEAPPLLAVATEEVTGPDPNSHFEKPPMRQPTSRALHTPYFTKSKAVMKQLFLVPDEENPKLSYCVQFPNGESARQVNVRLEQALMSVMRRQSPVFVVAPAVPAQGLLAFFADLLPEMAPSLRLPKHSVVEIGVKREILIHTLVSQDEGGDLVLDDVEDH